MIRNRARAVSALRACQLSASPQVVDERAHVAMFHTMLSVPNQRARASPDCHSDIVKVKLWFRCEIHTRY